MTFVYLIAASGFIVLSAYVWGKFANADIDMNQKPLNTIEALFAFMVMFCPPVLAMTALILATVHA